MQRSGSQKALLVFSIIEIVFSALGFLAGFASVLATGLFAGASASDLADAGISAAQQGQGTAFLAILSIMIIVSSLWGLLCGIFGIRAANDNQKIMIVWVFLLIGLILNAVSIIMSFVNGTISQDVWSLLFGLAFSIIMFWIANNIKREAGK